MTEKTVKNLVEWAYVLCFFTLPVQLLLAVWVDWRWLLTALITLIPFYFLHYYRKELE